MLEADQFSHQPCKSLLHPCDAAGAIFTYQNQTSFVLHAFTCGGLVQRPIDHLQCAIDVCNLQNKSQQKCFNL